MRGAVFDCDGLLVNTEDLWWAAFEATANALGHSLDGIDPATLHGASVQLAAERLGECFGREVPETDLRKTLKAQFDSRPIAPMPGAKPLLTSLAGRLPLAVATNAPADIADAALGSAGLRHFFSVLVSAEQTAAPKPAPYVYLEACRQLQLEPSEAIGFDDSAMGTTSARSAALTVIGVTADDGVPLEADLIVPRLDDPRVFGLLESRGLPQRGVSALSRAMPS